MKDAVLLAVGMLVDRISEFKDIQSNIEKFLLSFVFPEFKVGSLISHSTLEPSWSAALACLLDLP